MNNEKLEGNGVTPEAIPNKERILSSHQEWLGDKIESLRGVIEALDKEVLLRVGLAVGGGALLAAPFFANFENITGDPFWGIILDRSSISIGFVLLAMGSNPDRLVIPKNKETEE